MTDAAEHDADDVSRIRRLAQLMREFDLTEIVLENEGSTLAISRGGAHVAVAAAPTAAPLPAPAATPPVVPAVAPAAESALHQIISPMVGTFYVSSSPESPPFVKVGDHVGKDTTVCIVEAMKVFNEIPAEVSGKIVAVLVENGEPVEYGQPLFKVDPRV